MTLPSSGPISLRDVNVELGRSAGGLIRLGETDVRTLAGLSGKISLNDLRGKSSSGWSAMMTVRAQSQSLAGYSQSAGALVPDVIDGHRVLSIYQSSAVTFVVIESTVDWANDNLKFIMLDGQVFPRNGSFLGGSTGALGQFSVPGGFLLSRLNQTIPVGFRNT